MSAAIGLSTLVSPRRATSRGATEICQGPDDAKGTTLGTTITPPEQKKRKLAAARGATLAAPRGDATPRPRGPTPRGRRQGELKASRASWRPPEAPRSPPRGRRYTAPRGRRQGELKASRAQRADAQTTLPWPVHAPAKRQTLSGVAAGAPRTRRIYFRKFPRRGCGGAELASSPPPPPPLRWKVSINKSAVACARLLALGPVGLSAAPLHARQRARQPLAELDLTAGGRPSRANLHAHRVRDARRARTGSENPSRSPRRWAIPGAGPESAEPT